jgi:hypothetical protein
MALRSLALARARPRPAAARRVSIGACVAFCLAALVLQMSGGASPRQIQVSQIAAPDAFPILDWHLARIAERLPRIEAGLLGIRASVTPEDRAAAGAFFAAAPADRRPLEPAAESAIERAVTSVLLNEGIGYDVPIVPGGEILFPPVSFAIVAPPKVLIVSPRDRVAVERSELLKPTVTIARAEQIENSVDGLGYSSLVVPIGGLATFPTMVVEGTRPLDTVVAVTHEWIHSYLFFSPLGVRYWSSQEARTINETVADMVSRELGRRVERELGLEQAPAGRPDVQRPSDIQFRAMMRETRVTLDGLLKQGQVDEAEAYLRVRQQDFQAAGFQIRKLNQAYFAFYGSYGDAAAGVNPIPGQLGLLRAASRSPAEFLRRVSQLTSAADLARAVGD